MKRIRIGWGTIVLGLLAATIAGLSLSDWLGNPDRVASILKIKSKRFSGRSGKTGGRHAQLDAIFSDDRFAFRLHGKNEHGFPCRLCVIQAMDGQPTEPGGHEGG